MTHSRLARIWKIIAGGQGSRWILMADGSRAGNTRRFRTLTKEGREVYERGLADGSDPDLVSAPGLADVLFDDALTAERERRALDPSRGPAEHARQTDEPTILSKYEQPQGDTP